MVGLITERTQELVAGSSWKTTDYFWLYTDSPEMPRLLLPVSDFPLETRSVGDQVELRYVNVGGGRRYFPFRLER